MINYEKKENWLLIEDKIFFCTDTNTISDKINLMQTTWEVMKYWTASRSVIDFAGDYEIWWINFQVFEKNWNLSYKIWLEDKIIAIISNSEILDSQDFGGIDYRFYTQDLSHEKLLKLDADWEKININNI